MLNHVLNHLKYKINKLLVYCIDIKQNLININKATFPNFMFLKNFDIFMKIVFS
jgi:hypothetical protein